MWKLWLFVLVAMMPMDAWNELGDYGQEIAVEYVGTTYLNQINPKCAKVIIKVFDGEDGNVYFDAECIGEKPII